MITFCEVYFENNYFRLNCLLFNSCKDKLYSIILRNSYKLEFDCYIHSCSGRLTFICHTGCAIR